MANGKTHLTAGIASGLAAAAYAARDQTGVGFVAELLGGALGGAAGGQLPDVFEPAIHSWHRSTAHSFTTATAIGVTAVRSLSSWQNRCRANAIHHDALSKCAADGLARAWHAFVAFVWRLLSGVAAGLPAGYLSHLTLDACTPRCIPLLA